MGFSDLADQANQTIQVPESNLGNDHDEEIHRCEIMSQQIDMSNGKQEPLKKIQQQQRRSIQQPLNNLTSRSNVRK